VGSDMQARKEGLNRFVSGGSMLEVEKSEKTPAVPVDFVVPKNRDSAFEPPPWSGKPSPSKGYSVYLEVWKEASEPIARYNISDKPATIVGRHAEHAHIRTFHDSISRQHAAIV